MRLFQSRPEALCVDAPSARHIIDAHDQQWLTADGLSRSRIAVDDVWVRYLSLGGSADAVAVAAYLHGHVILDIIQRDLVTHAINELVQELTNGRSSPGPSSASGMDPVTGEKSDVIVLGEVTPRDDAKVVEYSVSRAPYEHEPLGGFVQALKEEKQLQGGCGSSRPDAPWPSLQTRLTSMFDPAEAENRRLESLWATRLFDSPPEERFDRITQQAQQMFGTSSAIISFIGRDRQFVKSSAGPSGADMPRDSSFCSHTIVEDRTLVVPNTKLDSRFADNELVRGTAHIRFYAGYPLTGPGGWRIGALCILDTEPRTFPDQNLRDFRVLADLAQREIVTT